MTHQVSIPAGFNPNNAVPADASVSQHSRHAAVTPPVPPATEQKPGYVPAPATPADTAPANIDPATYAAFQKWQADQAATTTAGTQTPPAEPEAPQGAAGDESYLLGADAATSTLRNVALNDPYLRTTMQAVEMVAPKLDMARALGNAVDRVDATLIDRAYIREVGGEQAERLIQMAEGIVQHCDAEVTRTITGIHAAAGGEQQFKSAVAVFNSKAPAYLKQAVLEGFNSLDKTRIQSATQALLEFVKDSGALPTAPTGHVQGNAAVPHSEMALSKEAFQTERLKLNRNDAQYANKERELMARRQLGKRMGI